MAHTRAEYVDDTYAIEHSARRLIAKGLKIVTGTLTIAASAYGGSAGEAFDYSDFGTRFLWMGLTPRIAGTIAGQNHLGAYNCAYDPVAKKVYLTVSGAVLGDRGQVCDSDEPYAELIVNFCLLVYEGGASAGSGLG